MRPLTDNLPKPLLEVAGKPLIEYHIEKLVAAGIRHIVINHAWLGDKIEAQLGDGSRFGVRISYSAEGTALETAGGIVNALPLLCPTDSEQTFWVLNGDVFCDVDLGSLPQTLAPGHGHLLMVNNPEHNPEGDFAIADGFLALEGTKYTFSGIAAYHRAFFDGLSPEKLPLAPILRKQIAQKKVTGQVHEGIWCDVGTPQRLQQLNESEG